MKNILFCKNVAYIRLTNKAGYSHSEDFCTLPPSSKLASLCGANANQLACSASDLPE